MSAGIALRPYQEQALDAIEAAAARGARRMLVVNPTGTGKTITFAAYISRRRRRTLVLAHREELLAQTIAKMHLVDPSLDCGLVRAESDELGAPVIVASVQTLAQAHRLARLPAVDDVIVDEAHHATAPTYRRILEHTGAFEPAGPTVLGFTATPERKDRAGLGHVFQAIVFELGLLDMIRRGYLADLRAVRVSLDADLSGVAVRGGDYADDELGDVLTAAHAPEAAVRAYLEHAEGRKALVFTPTVALARDMAAAFTAADVAAESVDGGTRRDERRAILDRFRAGETTVVANCAVLTEGFDEPSVECVIVARPTSNRPLYIQMIGRGTRLHPGKRDCLILDLVGAAGRLNLVTTASLFGLDPRELEGGDGVAVATARAAERQQLAAGGGRLVAEVVDLFGRRPMNWIRAGSGYVLALGGGHLLLQPAADGWSVVHGQRDGRRDLLASGLSLEFAQGWAEDEVRRIGTPIFVDRAAAWRLRPASDKQLALLRRYRVPVRGELTMGEASDLIDAAKARGYAS